MGVNWEIPMSRQGGSKEEFIVPNWISINGASSLCGLRQMPTAR